MKVEPKFNDFVPIRRGKFRHRHTHREESYVIGGRDWSDAPASEGTLKISGNHQKLGGDKEGSSPRVFGDSTHCWHLEFKLLVSQNMALLLEAMLFVVTCHSSPGR